MYNKRPNITLMQDLMDIEQNDNFRPSTIRHQNSIHGYNKTSNYQPSTFDPSRHTSLYNSSQPSVGQFSSSPLEHYRDARIYESPYYREQQLQNLQRSPPPSSYFDNTTQQKGVSPLPLQQGTLLNTGYYDTAVQNLPSQLPSSHPAPISCVTVADHVANCHVCGRLYKNDILIFIIIIIFLSIICILLLKRVLKL